MRCREVDCMGRGRGRGMHHFILESIRPRTVRTCNMDSCARRMNCAVPETTSKVVPTTPEECAPRCLAL
eukprot:1039207-Alexandrium_andersonii.AAC.1